MLLQSFVKMRTNFEQEDRPKEFVRNIDIGTGFKTIEDSDDDHEGGDLGSAAKYSPIRAVAADAESSFLHDIGEQSDSQLGMCDEIQSKTLSI
jgi:hypothetical protein